MFRVKEAHESETTTAKLRRLEYHVWVDSDMCLNTDDDRHLSADAQAAVERLCGGACWYNNRRLEYFYETLIAIAEGDGFILESDTGSGVTRRVVLIKWVADE